MISMNLARIFLFLSLWAILLTPQSYGATNIFAGCLQVKERTWKPNDYVTVTNVLYDVDYQMYVTNITLWYTNYFSVGPLSPPKGIELTQWSYIENPEAACLSNLLWNLKTNNWFGPPPEVQPIRPPGNQRQYQIKIPNGATIRGDSGSFDTGPVPLNNRIAALKRDVEGMQSLVNNPHYQIVFHGMYQRNATIISGACRTNDYVMMYTTDLSGPWIQGPTSLGQNPIDIPGCLDECCEGPVDLFMQPFESDVMPDEPDVTKDYPQLFMVVFERSGAWRSQN